MTIIQANEIKRLLKETNLSQTAIASEVGVTQNAVSNINLGDTWFKEDDTYPLRTSKRGKQRNPNLLVSNKCKTCGKPISSNAVQCINCSASTRRVAERPTREEFKQLLRTTTIATIARQFSVTDGTIYKWCDSYNLPNRARLIKQMTDEEWELV